MSGDIESGVSQQFRDDGIDARRRPQACAECLELAAAEGIGDGFGHHAERRVTL